MQGNITQLIQNAKSDRTALTNLLSIYDFVFRVCALRFCNEENFEDFVTEGTISLMERSIPQYTENEKFITTVVKNCLRYQRKFYLSYYADFYEVFSDDKLLEKYHLCCSLFGTETEYSGNSTLSFEETRDFVRSFIAECKDTRLQKLLELLYKVE